MELKQGVLGEQRIYICRLLLLCKHNTTTYIMEYRTDLGLGIDDLENEKKMFLKCSINNP
jgi:hypothetical protein